ncbi:alpha/beta fold hydrolase [Candidatus Omnitrophota bacterium]
MIIYVNLKSAFESLHSLSSSIRLTISFPPSAFWLLPFLIPFLSLMLFFGAISHAEQNHAIEEKISVVNNCPQINDADIETGKELIILIHGFFRTPRNMSVLKDFFISRGFRVFTPRLPTTFGSLEECTEEFERQFRKLQGDYSRIHFVGHSMGGLILRQFLSRNKVRNIGRCVLIGTPNKGTNLASMISWCWPLRKIVKPIDALQSGGVDIPPPLNSPPPDMGAIAGNGDGLFFGTFIHGENDGRVPVDSVSFKGMKELILLGYHHNEIHRKHDVAELVYRFLREGTFGKEQ